MGLVFKDANNKPADPKTARNRAILLSLPFAIVGLLALVFLLHDEIGSGFRMKKQMAMGLLSAAIVCGGLIALIFGISAKKEALKISASKTDFEKPWLKRKDWAERRIVSSSRKAVLLLWIFVAFWCIASTMICLAVVPQQLHQGHYAALIALIFPVIGLAIILFALKTTFTWRKFGRSIFAMAAVPATPGGTLAGKIQVKTKLQPRDGFYLRLRCVQRTKTGASNQHPAIEKILWQDEKWLRADLPQTDASVTNIPVFFKLPDDLPESTVSPGDGIYWRLDSSAALSGPDFQAAFDVPVFKLPEMPALTSDPTAQCQTSLDEIRRHLRSRNQVNDLPDEGKEFIFPAARNPGYASGATMVCLIWTGIIALLTCKRAPMPVVFVFGAIDLLMITFVFDLWFRRSQVAANSRGVTVQKAWFGFKQEKRLQATEIKNIVSDVGATAGHAVYYDLKVQGRDGKEFLLAKNLNSKPEADWIVRQMIAALKRPA